MIRHSLLLFTALVLSLNVFSQKTATIRGVVRDAGTGDPVSFCNVLLEGTTIGASADMNGIFVLSKVPLGTYTMIFSYVGYESFKESVTLSVAGEIVAPNIKLAEQSTELGPAIVDGGIGGMNDKNNPIPSLIIVGKKEIDIVPTTGGGSDIVSFFQTVPGVVSTGDTAVCLGSTAQLFAAGGVRYEWTNNQTLSCLTCPNPIAKPIKDTTTYFVRIYNEQNCSILDSVKVTTNPTDVKIMGNNEACVGDSLLLRAIGALEYEWFTKDSILCENCTEIVIYPQNNTRVYVKGSLRLECYGIDSLDIIGRAIAVTTINDTVLCLGKQLQLTTNTVATKYKWEPSLFLSCDTCKSPIATPDAPIQYRVTVTDGICYGYDTVNIYTTEADVNIFADDTIICKGSSTTITAQASDNVHYNWQPKNNLSCDTCREILVSPAETTTYICTVESKEQCIAHDTITVYVRSCKSNENIVFPDLLTCDTAIRTFRLVNDNPSKKNRIVTIEAIDNENTPFSILSPSKMIFEQTYNESTDIVFLFSPDTMGYFEKTFLIRTNEDEVIELILSGNGIQTFISLQNKDTNDIIPGEVVFVPIRFSSKDWQNIPSKEYYASAQYDSRHFYFMGTIISPSTNPLEFTVPIIEQAQKTTTVNFTIKTPSPFRSDITSCIIPFTQLLHDNKVSEMFITIRSDSPKCVFIDSMKVSTTVFACFTDGRLVSTSSTPYSFMTEKHDDHYKLYCSIGLSAHTVIQCHSITGEDYGKLFDAYTPEGLLTINIPTSIFSSGLYFISIHSGIYSKTLPIYIHN
jgi:hypothetical protein